MAKRKPLQEFLCNLVDVIQNWWKNLNRGKREKTNTAYQNTEHEKTFFERETSKLGIQMLESLTVIWDASTRAYLQGEQHF